MGKLLGSPHYMAPEVWNKKADKRSDIFAIGAVFYELLTGRKAFENDRHEDLWLNVSVCKLSRRRLPAKSPQCLVG